METTEVTEVIESLIGQRVQVELRDGRRYAGELGVSAEGVEAAMLEDGFFGVDQNTGFILSDIKAIRASVPLGE